MRPKQTWEERVEAKIDRRGPNECWNWKSGLNTAGVAVLSRGPTDPPGTTMVARYMWEEANGPIPEGMEIAHPCGNDGCCNPGHMELLPQGKHLNKVPPGRKPMSDEALWNSLVLRFRAAIPDIDTNECQEWPGCRDKAGYGRIGYGKSIPKAHRMAFMIHHQRAIAPGMDILHDCPKGDNHACCNWRHLREGTDADNAADRIRKKQIDYSKRSTVNLRRGSAHHAAKGNEQIAAEIRRRLAAGEMRKDLAAEYGLSLATIRRIERREAWKHVE